MDTIQLGESTQPLEAILLVRQKMERERKPDLELCDHLVLKDGPRTYKVAVHWAIKDRNTNKIHHHAVKIETYNKTSRKGWTWSPEHTVTLDDDGGDELRPLATFLGAIHGIDIPDAPGSYMVVPVSGDQVNKDSVGRLLNEITASNKAEIITQLLSAAKEDVSFLSALISTATAHPEASEEAVALLNLARYSAAINKLEQMIEADAEEGEFQKHLTQNSWIFGSEYSELVDQRDYTRNEQQDFVLRRTIDGYLEVIEIKTPLKGKPLFLKDPSHDTLYQRSDLSKVIGQTLHYLGEFDAGRYPIFFKDNEDTNKIRARIIIGCLDGDDEQADALRTLNGHLHRVEIFTFDQLLRIGYQALKNLQDLIAPRD